MPGLTAKVFRTFNASHTFSNLLEDMKPEGSMAGKIKAYNDANRTVAILCNHKRTITASHSLQMDKLVDRVRHSYIAFFATRPCPKTTNREKHCTINNGA